MISSKLISDPSIISKCLAADAKFPSMEFLTIPWSINAFNVTSGNVLTVSSPINSST